MRSFTVVMGAALVWLEVMKRQASRVRRVLWLALAMALLSSWDITGALQTAALSHGYEFVKLVSNPTRYEQSPMPGALIVQDETFQTIGTLDMGTVAVDGPGVVIGTKTIFLFNMGDFALTIRGIQVVQGRIHGLTFSSNLAPGLTIKPFERVPVTVTFDPTISGDHSPTLRVITNNDPVDLEISALGLSRVGDIQINADNTNMGGLALEAPAKRVDQFATIKNIGAQPLSIHDIRLMDGADQFAISGLPSAISKEHPLVLPSHQSQTIGLLFDAKQTGLQHGTIQIFSDDPHKRVVKLPVMGTELADTGTEGMVKLGNDFVAVEVRGAREVKGASLVQRVVSDASGKWEVTVESNQSVHVAIFDPESGLVADQFFRSRSDGKVGNADFVTMLDASDAPDENGNGMPDDIDFAMGQPVGAGRVDRSDAVEGGRDSNVPPSPQPGPRIAVTEADSGWEVSAVDPVDFGFVEADGSGGDRGVRRLQIQNRGNRNLTIHSFEIARNTGDPTGFAMTGLESNTLVPPGEFRGCTMTFDPHAAGKASVNLILKNNDPLFDGAYTITVTGVGVKTAMKGD